MGKTILFDRHKHAYEPVYWYYYYEYYYFILLDRSPCFLSWVLKVSWSESVYLDPSPCTLTRVRISWPEFMYPVARVYVSCDPNPWILWPKSIYPDPSPCMLTWVPSIIINMLVPVSWIVYLRALLVLYDRGILAHATSVTGHYSSNWSHSDTGTTARILWRWH
jgi:hypothetical protein